MENEEKRMISSYEVTQSIHIGKKGSRVRHRFEKRNILF